MKTEDSLLNKSERTTDFLWSWEQASPLTKVTIGLIQSKSTLPLISLKEISTDLLVVEEFDEFDLVEAVNRGIGWKIIGDSQKVGQIARELAVLANDETCIELAERIELDATESGVEFVVSDLNYLWNMASLHLDLSTLPAEATD
jgi:hypothetical protein